MYLVSSLALWLEQRVTYIGLRQHNHKWLELKREGSGVLLMGEALDADLPLPHTTPPAGQVKLLNRGTGKETELGYLVKTKTDKLDVSRIPEKYQLFAVVYAAHLEFALKDADGFVLMSTKSPPLGLWSGLITIVRNPCSAGGLEVVPLLQFSVLRLGLLQHGKGVSVLPECQEILIRSAGFGGVALQGIGGARPR